MRTTTRFAIILLSLACAYCGDSTADEKSDMDPSTEGNNGGNTGGGSTAATGATGVDATNGGDDDAGTSMPPPPAITGMEPECIAAFTRVSECYLTQAKCAPTAKDSAAQLGQALAVGNCKDIAGMAGGLAGLASQWNAQTACDTQSVTAVFPQLDMNKQIKGLCETVALTAAECTTSCTNFVACKDSLPDAMMIKMALGTKESCEANCMTPANASIFRCGITAGTMCTAVAACFAP